MWGGCESEVGGQWGFPLPLFLSGGGMGNQSRGIWSNGWGKGRAKPCNQTTFLREWNPCFPFSFLVNMWNSELGNMRKHVEEK